jgi:hypothetical protein
VEENEGDDDAVREDFLDRPGPEMIGSGEYVFGAFWLKVEILFPREEVLGVADGYPATRRLSERPFETLFVDGSKRLMLEVGRTLSLAGLLRTRAVESRLMAPDVLPGSLT